MFYYVCCVFNENIYAKTSFYRKCIGFHCLGGAMPFTIQEKPVILKLKWQQIES